MEMTGISVWIDASPLSAGNWVWVAFGCPVEVGNGPSPRFFSGDLDREISGMEAIGWGLKPKEVWLGFRATLVWCREWLCKGLWPSGLSAWMAWFSWAGGYQKRLAEMGNLP